MSKKLLVFIIGGILGAIWGTYSHAHPPRHFAPPSHYHQHYSHSGDAILGAIGILGGLVVLNAITQPRQTETIIVREAPKNRIVYWCESQRGFYPDIRSCPEGWRTLEIK